MLYGEQVTRLDASYWLKLSAVTCICARQEWGGDIPVKSFVPIACRGKELLLFAGMLPVALRLL